MSAWRFSWRAIGAAVLAAMAAGLGFALMLAVCSALVDENDRALPSFLSLAGLLFALAAVCLAGVGGLLLALISFVAVLIKVPRPWTDVIVLTGVCVLATTVGGVGLELTTPDGPLTPQHPVAFFVAYVAPAVAGAAMALFYWRFAPRAQI